MQGISKTDRDLWDAGDVTGHLVPPGSVFAFLAAHRTELFPGSFRADLFPSRTGRPSLPAGLVGAVLVLKELHDLSDPQTADALKSGIRWKVACGRSLTQMSFDPSTLVYWRRRIAASSRPDRVFDAVAAVIAETGILAGRRKRCVDSTVSGGAAAGGCRGRCAGAAGAGRRAGRGARAGLRRHGRAVADRPQGPPRPGHQHHRPPGAAHPQEQVEAPRRVP